MRWRILHSELRLPAPDLHVSELWMSEGGPPREAFAVELFVVPGE